MSDSLNSASSARAGRPCHLSPCAHFAWCAGALTVGLMVTCCAVLAQDPVRPKPVPDLQAIPQPYDQLSFQREGREIARYHFGKTLHRPFLFPLNGPSGRSLTRMGHPRDPVSHSHHNSVWVAHNSVNGVSFWDDRSPGRIVHQQVEKIEDEGNGLAAVTTVNHWVGGDDGRVLLVERRRTEVRLLEGGEWTLVLDVRLEVKDGPVTLGKTPFGLVGVRMAKTVGVRDGGGNLRNSEGAAGESGVFWKPARWVDYSGPIARDATEGITLMDHPSNPNHPAVFHVREDGWMGTSLTFDADRTIEQGNPLALRYGLYVHAGAPTPERINEHWTRFSKLKPPAQ